MDDHAFGQSAYRDDDEGDACWFIKKDIFTDSARLVKEYCSGGYACCSDGCCKSTSPWWWLFVFIVIGFLIIVCKKCCRRDSAQAQPPPVNHRVVSPPPIRLTLLDERGGDNLRPQPSAPMTPPPSYEDAVIAPSLDPNNRIPSYEDVMQASAKRNQPGN